MALSAYGKINYKLIELFDNIQEKYKNRLIGFAYGTHVHDIYNGLFSKHPVNIEDFYATLQYYSTELVVNNLKKYKSSDNLCLSGGCALNGYINEEILKRKIYKKIHIPPAVTDEGQSLGAALHALYILEGKRVNINNPNKIMYLGESYSVPEYIKENLKLEDDELYTFLAKKISEGYVIGWYQGRSESGPRALGNRSILADPRNPKMKDHINFKVKKREWYRPFAPSVLMEEASKWFILNGNRIAPYMTRILKYKKGKSKHVPATTHIDDTARIQTVTEEINPRYYKLIKEFFKLTNVPILLNTSFNGKNEPIVETPSNAFKCFQKNNIDILVLENNVYFRNGDKNIKPFIEESNVDGNDR
jgi:carbamoyltransferase